ncbi:MAG: anthranilate synthase component I family protein [Desulfarculus sp.]|nr:anthranilate synthase component I family protein [Desulfarculus sp.]
MSALIASHKTLLADTDTPVSAYLKLCQDQEVAFLFESGETVERFGRFSVVACDPLASLVLWPERAELDLNGAHGLYPAGEFFALARRMERELACKGLPALPFVGALAGYLGFDAVRLVERLPPAPAHRLPVAQLCYPSRLAVFDHLKRQLTLVAIAAGEGQAQAKLREMEERLQAPFALPGLAPCRELSFVDPPKEHYLEAVKRAKEYILDGDIFQVVLSERFTGVTDLDPLRVYRWLRVKSPSPYMFFLKLGDCHLLGSSPETMVRVQDGRVYLRPIAGTRGRSDDRQRDQELEREMLASEKECAEHVMLVDLARNDAGRVSAYGSVAVEPYMTVERYSHVMHIVSQVSGLLRPELDAWDAFQAGFPAGTVSGAPKVRAMEIITELEDGPRGPYAGAVGFFGPGRQMDTCIAIRMVQFEGRNFTLQVGAGIVADSVPEMEFQEITHKAAQGIAALKAAARGEL